VSEEFLAIIPKEDLMDIIHRCGSFMGEPLSFISLTDTNLLIEDLSSYFYYCNNRTIDWNIPIDHRCVVISNPCAITGDDVAALRFDLKRSVLHRGVARDIGMVFSIGKDGDSVRVMIFCEDHILLNLKEKTPRVFRLQYVDVIKSRLLTTMSRDHADGRAAIFGKGRMLGQQLAWYPNPLVREIVLSIFHFIFEKKYTNVFKAWALPYFLPPVLGGLGIPVQEIPPWGFRYINYIVDQLKDWKKAIAFVWQCRHLTGRNRWGWDDHPKAVKLALSDLKDLKRLDNIDDVENHRQIYSLDQVFTILKNKGCIIPKDPYTGDIDFEQVKVFAHNNGYIELDGLVDQYERVLTFQDALDGKSVVCDKTLVLWSRRSSRMWSKIRPKNNSNPHIEVGKLEKQAFEALNGFIFREFSTPVLKYGPSLNLRIEELSGLHTPLQVRRNIRRSSIDEESDVSD